MRIPRELTLIVHYFFDQIIPPVLRDSKWFMFIPFKLLFGVKADIFFRFKQQAPFLSGEEFANTYRQASSVFIQRKTDINLSCLEKIESMVSGDTILDIACGRGFLAQRLSSKYRVTGSDIFIDPKLINKYPQIRFREANLENLPFADKSFDTVVCAHTLEHVQNIQQAIAELRRVTAKRLIIVVPKQRPYNYTFDLHIHFFPYRINLYNVLGGTRGRCWDVGGDWFYCEDRHDVFTSPASAGLGIQNG